MLKNELIIKHGVMIVSISGAQCTGKTTLIEALKKEECLKGSLFMGSPSRKGNDRGIKINKEAGIYDQLWIATSYVKEIIESAMSAHDHIISDRCLLDVLCYTEYNRDRSSSEDRPLWDEMVDTVTQLLVHIEPLYSHHIVLRPEFKIVDDGVRSTDEVFQKEIDRLFEKNARMLQDFAPRGIHYVSGSIDERVSQVLDIMEFNYRL